ncbi:MAG: hypothetical protein AAFY17_02495 [Cyanobacteria bacterium J06642_11]
MPPTMSGKALSHSPIGRVAIGLFVLLGLVGLAYHSMWRDEFNTWLIVRDSDSLGEILGYVHYQGHTALWALCITAVQQITQQPWGMKAFHWAVAMVSITTFWQFSPFTQRQKILFSFGYLPFYQYLLVSRPYVLGMAFLFLFCTLFPIRRHNYLPLAVVLVLLANSHAYGLFITLALTFMLVVEWLWRRWQAKPQPSWWNSSASLLLVLVGIVIALYILIPPGDSTNHGGVSAWIFSFDLRHLLRSICRVFAGYFLIIPTHKRWLDLIFGSIVAIGMVSATVTYLRRTPLALLFYSTATGILFTFTYVRFLGLGQRHFGQFYLILLAALWLAHHERQSLLSLQSAQGWLTRLIQNRYGIILGLVLWVQCLGGIGAFTYSFFTPLSASRAAVGYIQRQGWQSEYIVASRDATMAPIAGYLNRQLYYPERNALGTFTLFNQSRRDVDHDEVLQQTQELLTGDNPPARILLILSKELNRQALNNLNILNQLQVDPIEQFERAWQEKYYLYWVTRQTIQPS